MCDNNNGNDNTNQSVCGNMGYYADKSTGRGQLYLRTREEEPVNEKLTKKINNCTELLPFKCEIKFCSLPENMISKNNPDQCLWPKT